MREHRRILGQAPSSEVADWGLDGATHSPIPRKCGWALSSHVGSLARSGAEAQTGQRDIDPARVAESCSQRRHRGRCADAPSWCTDSRSVLAVTWAKAWAVPRALL